MNERSDRRWGWVLGFIGVLLLSAPVDEWFELSGGPLALWQLLAGNQAILALLMIAWLFLDFRREGPQPESVERLDRHGLRPSDRQTLRFALAVPTPRLEQMGRRAVTLAVVFVGGLLLLHWLDGLRTMRAPSDFIDLVGELFWVALLVGLAILAYRLVVVVKRLHRQLRVLERRAPDSESEDDLVARPPVGDGYGRGG